MASQLILYNNHPLPLLTKEGNWALALSQGERVARVRRFHQPARAG